MSTTEMYTNHSTSGHLLTEVVSFSSHPEENEVPRELLFSADSLVSIITYSIIFIVAAVGNLTVFLTLFFNRRKGISRVSVFIMHLSVADLIVTFIMIPMEVAWHATVSWRAGDIACRLLMFFRTFGLYLSSFILIGISLDRYLAITRPLSIAGAGKRVTIMLVLAWLFSVFASIPQSVIFHLEHHPDHPWFNQCVTFNFFPTRTHEMAYNLFNVFMLYVIPLVVIVVSYSLMLHEMSRRTKLHHSSAQTPLKMRRQDPLRRSGVGQLEKARVHTFKMTVVIVSAFIVCWTPYFLMMAVWWIDKDIAKTIDAKIQRGLFIFAVSNSCVNPVVYGMFTNVFRQEARERLGRVWNVLRRKRHRFKESQFEIHYYENKRRQ